MSDKRFTVEKQGPVLKITFLGVIDEDFPFKELQVAGVNQLDIYLSKVQTINSCGIRDWVRWLTPVSSQVKVTFHECSKVIVDQINMVKGFLPAQAKVESFYVPYFSNETEENKLVLFRNGHEFSTKKVNAPTDVKDESGNIMELDVVEKRYFGFIMN